MWVGVDVCGWVGAYECVWVWVGGEGDSFLLSFEKFISLQVFSDDLFPYYHDEDGFPQTMRAEGGKPINRFG